VRLWSIHPKYLDAKGLVALWREGLLAQKVLQGKTRGYKNHPQLIRFRNCGDPAGAIATYLKVVADEAQSRGYRFNRNKLLPNRFSGQISIKSGQMAYEFDHLMKKLQVRDPAKFTLNKKIRMIDLHPLFRKVKGGVEEWEKTDFSL
jgi:hypothetical protein